jgi:MADS-box transcription factor
LPSPLTFPTPAVPSGPSFSREDEQDKKRKTPDGGLPAEGASKKPKT